MENWGLITYRTVAILFDEETSDARLKNRVAYVVAHGQSCILKWCSKIITISSRTGSSMVWQSRHHGLVERVVA